MKFLVDAQLPRQLASFLVTAGHDAVHTSELSLGNRTPDRTIAILADRQDRTVVTKDRDFWIGHVLEGCPRSLLIVATGNITNAALLALVAAHLEQIVGLLSDCSVVEMGRDRLVAHTDRAPGAPMSG
ncbi:DUF5615 family PIN-like protein [Nocardia pseudovaccinii]|uniref:DUF5615 family PIN-like protein n=1 Tax=Nocardia pseudovaccinii TaxID=189540 RepID=UPI0007A3E88F|nr:DUF5615 family PIN-like protein [Nocardia pseudovaccinii]